MSLTKSKEIIESFSVKYILIIGFWKFFLRERIEIIAEVGRLRP